MHAQDQAARLRALVESQQAAHAAPRVIAVASGKGGTGKSTLAVNMAIALRRMGKQVLLIDADFGLANVDLMLGVTSRRNLSQVLTGEFKAQDVIQQGVEGVRFLSGGSGVAELLTIDESGVEAVLGELLQSQGDADIILLDVGAGVSPVVLKLLSAADETIVVTTPEPTSVMDAYALIKTLAARDKEPVLRLVVNRVDTRREAAETPEAIISLARANMQLDVKLLGVVSNDALVPQTIKRQVPILVSHPGAQASREIVDIARKLAGMPALAGGGLAAFFARFMRIHTTGA